MLCFFVKLIKQTGFEREIEFHAWIGQTSDTHTLLVLFYSKHDSRLDFDAISVCFRAFYRWPKWRKSIAVIRVSVSSLLTHSELDLLNWKVHLKMATKLRWTLVSFGICYCAFAVKFEMASTKCKRIFSHVTNAIDSTATFAVRVQYLSKLATNRIVLKFKVRYVRAFYLLGWRLFSFCLCFGWVDGRLDLCRPEHI